MKNNINKFIGIKDKHKCRRWGINQLLERCDPQKQAEFYFLDSVNKKMASSALLQKNAHLN